jgi:hypothetical protein
MKYSALLARQKGQSLLWVLGFLATMAVTFAGVYSVGQTTSEKQKIVNAVDAAAYTGGMVEARALNLTAYANRAEIANEVFIAQMTSMESWVAYMKETIDSFQTVSLAVAATGIGAPIALAVNRVLSIVETALDGVLRVLKPAVDAAVFGVDNLYYLPYKLATAVLFSPAMVAAAQSAAESTLAANVATQDGKIDTAPVAFAKVPLGLANAARWNSAFKLYTKSPIGSASDGRRNAAEILEASLDEFSTSRDGSTWFGIKVLWGNASLGECPGPKIGASKDGTTKLKDYDRWEAQDTSEYYITGGIRCRKRGVPYGWGRSTVAKQETNGEQKLDPHYLAGLKAYSDTIKHSSWDGVKSLWDIARKPDDTPIDAFKQGEETLTFTVAAKKASTEIKNNESLNFMNRASTSKLGSTDLKADMLDGQLSAKAEARVFFSRPSKTNADITGTRLFRADSHKEVSNLYNPYWQVRLKSMDLLSAETAAIYGGNAALAAFAQ